MQINPRVIATSSGILTDKHQQLGLRCGDKMLACQEKICHKCFCQSLTS
jgi:hypothetical protein